MVRHEAQSRPTRQEGDAVRGATDTRGGLRDRLEHRLEIGGRAADDAEHVAGRLLLLDGLGQLSVARLQLLEQADVLDGDDRLVGEGLQQLDLAI
jgi:hypothetical protein